MSYDHSGRLLSVKENINNTGWVWTNISTYNEKDELIEKRLHSTDSTSFLQKLDYGYNVRGWMTGLNDPTNLIDPDLGAKDYFAMSLYYETGDESQHNGNISGVDWVSDKSRSSNITTIITTERTDSHRQYTLMPINTARATVMIKTGTLMI
jgi:hypothetical protein